ncbi:protein of unknown function [Xenorhabdus doucetiae]|uniref:Uncharacterized protein n=1 Tax=Xenorhabdus doucetiae TaxID=351671 RepID=A0A068QUM7_9GAMM|nr:protein of unknown function [Xenorhabdus doucetiae]
MIKTYLISVILFDFKSRFKMKDVNLVPHDTQDKMTRYHDDENLFNVMGY